MFNFLYLPVFNLVYNSYVDTWNQLGQFYSNYHVTTNNFNLNKILNVKLLNVQYVLVRIFFKPQLVSYQ